MKKYILLVPGAVFLLIAAGLAVATSSASAAGDKCYQTVVDVAAHTETIQHPAETRDETTTVTDEPARDEVIPATEGHFENLQWHVYTGNVPDGSTPDVNDPNFMPVPALPNGLPHAPVPGTVYNVSHGESGLGSWFKYDGDFVEGTPEQTIHHPAVTHDVTTTIVVKRAWTENVKHPAETHQVRVPCDNEPPEVEGKQQTAPTVAVVQQRVPGQRIPTRPAAPTVEVPTSVDAGL